MKVKSAYEILDKLEVKYGSDVDPLDYDTKDRDLFYIAVDVINDAIDYKNLVDAAADAGWKI